MIWLLVAAVAIPLGVLSWWMVTHDGYRDQVRR